MSQESTTPDLVERTSRLYQAADVGDFDAMMRFFSPDSSWDMGPMGMGTFEGLAAVRGFLEDRQGSYEEYEGEVEEVVELGRGVTLAVSLQRGRPVGSSGDVQIRVAAVYTWVEGLIIRATTYGDIDEARAAAASLAQERA